MCEHPNAAKLALLRVVVHAGFLSVVPLAVTADLRAEREPLSDGTIVHEQKLSMASGGFSGQLQNEDRFGSAIALLGDLDGDGQPEVAVGAPATDDGGDRRGAVWILSLDSAGMATSATKISALHGGFEGALDDGDRFGFAPCGARRPGRQWDLRGRRGGALG